VHFASDAEAKINDEAERLQGAIDEHRALIGRLREELDRAAQEVAKTANAELEQHAADRRRALQEVAERLRRREQELQQQIDHEHAEVTQRIGAQLGDVEHRQIEQLRRTVSREATRHAEAAAQQFDGTFRTAREEAAKRLGRELDLAIERFAREAEGLLAERIEHLTQTAVQRIAVRVVQLARRLEELGART
jgi:DNA anti-recombination protein RmuC